MKIIIIGGVAAGMSAAAKAKRLDKNLEIVVYEKTEIVSWGACGLPYFIGGFFSDAEKMIARTPEEFIDLGIDVKINHEVLSVDNIQKKLEIKNLKTGEIFYDEYDKLLIATGAKAINPPIKNINSKDVFKLKEFTDGIKLKEAILKKENQKIIIIGAGYIGIEVAEGIENLKKESIRIIQLGERVLLESFDKEITDIIQEELNSYEKIKLHCNEIVEEIMVDDEKVMGVKTNKDEYEADIVIVAIGVKPNTEFLKNLGLNTLRNGAIIVNEKGETNIENIYSAGDCATVYHLIKKENMYIPLATTASKLGRVIGENFAGLDTNFEGTLGSAAAKIFRLEAGRTGITEKDAKELGLDYKTVFLKDKNQTSYYPGQEDIYIKLIYDSVTRVILGGQIVGRKGGVLRVDSLALAIYNKMTVDKLGMMDFCYTPPFTKTWDPMNVAGNIAK